MNANRRLVIALCISLAVNVFAAGFVVARALHRSERVRERAGERAMHGPFMGPRGLLGLDAGAKARPVVTELMKRHGEGFRAERSELRKSRRAVHDALAADTFDAAQLERALTDLRARTQSSQARMHVALVELARSLPPEQRRGLAKRAHVLEMPEPPSRMQRR